MNQVDAGWVDSTMLQISVCGQYISRHCFRLLDAGQLHAVVPCGDPRTSIHECPGVLVTKAVLLLRLQELQHHTSRFVIPAVFTHIQQYPPRRQHSRSDTTLTMTRARPTSEIFAVDLLRSRSTFDVLRSLWQGQQYHWTTRLAI